MNTQRISLAAMLALALTAGAASAAADSRAARYYEDALQRFEKNDMAGAIVQLKNALKSDRKLLPVHTLMGRALQASGDVIAADVAFAEALSLGVDRGEIVVPWARAVVAQGKPQRVIDDPRFAPAGLPAGVQSQLLLVRAGALADLGDLRGSLKALEESRALDPLAPDSWLAEVPVRIRMAQLREALAAADKAVSLAPDNDAAHYLRGTVLHAQGDTVQALAAYDRALKLRPQATEALVSRAGLLLDQGRNADAAADVAELLRSSPREPRAKYLKALLAERQGDAAGAKAALADLTGLLDPVPMEFLRYRPQMLMLGGLAHHGLNEREKARPYLEMLQRQQPANPVSKLLAQIYLADNNADRAAETLETYLRAHPGDAQAVQLLAATHMAKGRYARASQLMKEALRSSDQPASRLLLGMSLAGGGKFVDAIDELEAALRKDPGQVAAGTALAGLYLQSGQPAKAARIADGLLKARPNDPGLLTIAGNARAAQGDAAGARRVFEQALKIDPAFGAPQLALARLDIAAKAWDSALARLSALLKADEKNTDVLQELARVAEARGQLADAQRMLEKADDSSGPGSIDAALALVDFHLRNGRVDAAREASRRLTTKAPEALPVLLTLARVSLALGDTAAARTGLSRAASVAAQNPTVLVQVALLQLQAGHLAGAAYSVDKALAARPEFLPAMAMAAEIELRQGELAKGEQRARQIVAKHPQLGVGYALLGDAAMARRQSAAAVEHYRRAHQLEASTASLLRLARAVGAGDAAAAVRLAESWVKVHPRDIEVLRLLGDAQARAGQYAPARRTYEALLKAAPDDAEGWNNMAHLQLLTGDTAAAAQSAERALQLRPGAAHIIGTAGWMAFKSGQADRGLQLLRDARLRDPENRDTRYFLGSVLAGAGRTAEAREELQAALRGTTPFANQKEAEQLLGTLK